MYNRGTPFSNVTPVVKNLLILNIGVLVLGFVYTSFSGIDAARVIGLYYFKSEAFRPFQIVSHMFMHAGIMHLFFNMYALWLFGQILERTWGGKRFLIYYLITGLGAAALHLLVIHFRADAIMSQMSAENIQYVIEKGMQYDFKANVVPLMAQLDTTINIPTVGASGAVFGVLLAFGMFYPNVELFLFFIPVPIKAKYFVIGYGAIELINGVMNTPGDNVAHFAHLGGMLFGFILIKIWQKSSNVL